MRLYELNEDINQKIKFYGEVRDEKWRDKNDCAIVALAILCDISYEEAKHILMKNDNNKTEGTGHIRVSTLKSINDLGFEYHSINQNYYLEKINQSLPDERKIKKLTCRDLHNYSYEIFKDEPEPHNQLWACPGHVFACKNGNIQGIMIGSHEINYVIDVFKPGQKPVRDISNDNFNITNYDECVDRFNHLYNIRTSENYNISRKYANEIFQDILRKCHRKNQSIYYYHLTKRTNLPETPVYICIEIHDNGSVSVS